jgi:transposase
MLYVGVDLGLDRSSAKVRDERAKLLGSFDFPHSRDGYDFFFRRVQALVDRHQASGFVVGMEPTNYFWTLLATELEGRRVDYYLINPYTVKKHREGDQLDRSKDDPRDASQVSDLLREGKYTETRLLRGGYAELRQHATMHNRLMGDIGRQKTLVRNIVGQLFPELSRVFKDLTCRTAVAMLMSYAAAVRIKDMTLNEFVAAVRANASGKRLAQRKLRRAHGLAATSVGVQNGVEALQLALRLHLQTLQSLQVQELEVRQAMLKAFEAMPEARYLRSLGGLAALTCAKILAEIGDPSRYQHGHQLIKLAGTQPTPDHSGRKNRSATPFSRKGRARLRTILYFACLRLIQVDDAFARLYQRYQQREKNPLTKMQALGVLMNKLLLVLWSLMRYKQDYDPARVCSA